MYRQTYSSFKPEATPRALKIFLLCLAAGSLLSALLPAVHDALSLSLNGLRHFFLWQMFTYPFAAPQPGSLSFASLLQLALNLYLCWIFGASLLQRMRPSLFFTLYFGSAAFGALSALAPLFLFPAALSGPAAPLYALLIAWAIRNPDAQILLFFTLPFQAKWLVLGLLAASLAIDASTAHWISFAASLGSAFFGYLFALVLWRSPSSYPFLLAAERRLFRFLTQIQKWKSRFAQKKTPLPPRHAKIYDIRSGEPILDDEAFLDAMLSRISLHGKDSLTPEEKKRMQNISERKKNLPNK